MHFDTIHHIAIIVSNRQQAKEFYINKLGFSLIRENKRLDRHDWKIDLSINETTELEIFVKEDAAGGGSALIKGHDVFHGGVAPFENCGSAHKTHTNILVRKPSTCNGKLRFPAYRAVGVTMMLNS